jgi:hypothetical protein
MCKLKQHNAINGNAKKIHYFHSVVNINARVGQIEVTVNSNIIVLHIAQYGLFMIMLEPDNLTVLC